MSTSLIERYKYGNSGWITPVSVEADILIGGTYKERLMINVAKKQIKAQQSAASKIAISQLEAANVVAAEIEKQTLKFENTIHQLEQRISDEISFSTEQVLGAINILNDRLCMKLDEIYWAIEQLDEKLEKILYVLRNSRNNEVQQLVKQGVRHYVIGEYEEAEERFKLALQFDTTDYQLLMNLGYIEIHKNNANDAFVFFKKALSLPDNLDSTSKVRTLWAITRLYYAEEDYEKAITYAKEAISNSDIVTPKNIFTLGGYAALAGKKTLALKKIEEAINLDLELFSLASIEPDLDIIRNDVIALLSRISHNALSKAKDLTYEIEDLNTETFEEESLYLEFYDGIVWGSIVQQFIEKSENILQNPSYSDCLQCIENMRILQKVFILINKLNLDYHNKKLEAQKNQCREDINNKLKELKW